MGPHLMHIAAETIAGGRRDGTHSQGAVHEMVRRVVLVVQSTSVGGMETHCVDLAAEYTRRGISVLTVIPEPAVFDSLDARFVQSGARVERLNTDGFRGRAAQIRNLSRLVRTLRAWRPDVVHLHTGGATGGAAVVLAARRGAGAVAVVTEHDVPDPAPSLHQRLARKLIDIQSDAIVAVSRRNAGLRQTRLPAPPHKLAAVLNGVPVPDVSEAAKHRHRKEVRGALDIAQDALVIGSLVRLAPGKGLHDLLAAFAIMRRDVPAILMLVGDGPLRAELAALAAGRGIAGDVRFAGHQAMPGRYLDAMDAFVLAVPAGSQSVALLEAMARGLPSVITFGGPEEPVIDGRTGLCAPPADPEGLAKVLLGLRDSSLRQRLGPAAAAYVRESFSVQRVADDLLDVYANRRRSIPARLRADAMAGSVEGPA